MRAVTPVPDGDRYPACDATPRRPAARPAPRAIAGRRRQRGVALTAPVGPPYPDPVDGQAVYDYAGVLRPATVAQAEAIVDAIEAQTKAEVVVYTQALDATTSRPRRPRPTPPR